MTNRISFPLGRVAGRIRRFRGASFLLATTALLSVAQAGTVHAQTNTVYTPGDNPGSPNLAAGDRFTLTGGNVVFGSNSANDMTFDGTVTGDGGLTKSGTATLTLNAVNSYAGGTTINAGVVAANVAGALPTGGAVTMGGGTLKLGADQHIGALNGMGNIQLNDQNLNVDIGSGVSRYDGTILGGYTYVGSWLLSTAPYWGSHPAVYTGQEAAALLFGGNPSDYAISSVSSAVADIDFQAWGSGYGGAQTSTPVAQNYKNDAGTPGYSGVGDFSAYVSDWNYDKVNYAFTYGNGGGSLTKTGDGTLILGGSNAYSGPTSIEGGTLAVDGGQAISDTAAVAVGNAGTFEVIAAETVGSLSGGGHVVLGQTLTTGGDDSSTVYSGAISGAGGLVKTGDGTLTLTGSNTYTGTTSITGGTLAVDGGQAIADAGAVVIGSGGTFEVMSAETIGSLSGSGAVVLDQTLTVGGNNGSTVYAGTIGGVGGLTKTGTGTLTLSGANSYTGLTSIEGGTLAVDGGHAISDTAAVAVGSSGTFRVIAAETVGSLSGGGHVVLDQTLTTGDNGSTTYSGEISGAGGLVKTGTGTLTLTGANSYIGGTIVAAGTLQGDTNSIQGNVVDSGTLAFSQDFDGTYSGSVSGSGALVKAGTGTLTLASANSYTGGTTVAAGTLVADVAGALATGGDVAMTGGTLKLGANQSIGALSGTGAVDLGNSILGVDIGSGTTRFDGSISGASGSIDYAGSWRVADGPSWGTHPAVLSGQETAALLFGGDAGDYAISTVSSDASDINHMAWGDTYAGPILTVAEDYKVDGGAPGYSQSGDFSTYVFDHVANNVNYAFFYSPSGALTKTGDGTLILGGVNTYTGATTIADGTLAIDGGHAIADIGAVVIGSGGTFEVMSAEAIGSLSGSGAVVLDQTLTVGGDNGSTVYAGTVSGAGGLTKTGTGTLTLSGANSYTGVTRIDGGTLAIEGGQAIADTGSVAVGNAGTFQVKTAETIGSLSGSGTVVLDQTLTAGGDNGSTAYSGAISGAGGLVKTGTGTLTLAGTNSYAGGTTIAAGTLQGDTSAIQGNVVDNGALAFAQDFDGAYSGNISGTGTLAKAGTGTLTLTGTNSYAGGTTITAGTLQGDTNAIQGDIVNNAALAFSQDFDGTYSGSISGTGALTKTGSGTLILGGVNTYTGTTTIAGGTLAIDGGQAIADTSAVAIGSAGTFQVKTAETIGSLSGSGAVILDQALTLGGDSNTAYSGGISGSGALVKTGAGTLTLSGTNNYTGGTIIAAGMLQGDTRSIQGNVLDNTTLTFAQDFDGAYAGSISGSGALVKTGSGAVTLAGTDSHSGGTRIEGGALIGTTGNLLGAIVDNANLVFQQDADGDFAGSISGTGNVFKAGTGTVRVTGATSYTGITGVMQGRLIGSADTIRGDISVAQGATLEFDQAADGTYAGNMVDAQGVGMAGQLVKSGTGALTVTGRFGAQGGTLIEQGSLIGTGETLWGDFAIDDGATLQIGEAEGQGANFSGAISGTGSFVKTGAGTLQLSGRSTGFAGSTDIATGAILLTGALNGSVTIQQGATLQVGDGATSGDLLADTANDGTLIFDQAGIYFYAGALSGNGSLVKQGDGALTLAGAYSYTGSTIVEGGRVTISSLLPTTTTLQIDGGSLDLGSTDQSVSGLTGNGGSLNFGGGMLTVDQEADYGFGGSLIGTGTLVKSGSGTLNLLGDSSLEGDVLVDAGTLGVRGSLASVVTVSDGATLTGTGTVGGMVIRSGGIAAPGSVIALQNARAFRAFAVAAPASPFGTLHVSGNVTFEAGSLYQVNVDATGEGDKIAATGSASLQGGTVQVLAATGSYAPLTHYTLLSADGGVTGTFSEVTSNLAFLTPVLSYGAKTVSLDLVRNDTNFVDIARSSNERNVAGKVTALGAGNSLFNSVLFMDADGARRQFNQLSGEIHASARTAMLNDAALPMTATIDHLVETPAHSGVWMQGLANWSQIDANGESARTRSNAQGLMGGVDIVVAPELRLGLAGGYTHDNLSAPAVGSTAKLKGTHVLGYASGGFGGVELRVGGGYSHFDADTTRVVPVADAGQRLTARYGVDVVQGFGEIAYPLKLGSGAVAPYGNLAVTDIARPNFAETGGSVALASGKANDTTAISSIGIRFETAPAGVFSVGGKLGWEHAWGALDPVSEMTLPGTSGSFEVIGAPLSRNSASVAVSGRLHLPRGLTASVGYEGRIGSSNQSNAVKGAISLRF